MIFLIVTISSFLVSSVNLQDIDLAKHTTECINVNELFSKEGPGCPQTCENLNRDCYKNTDAGCFCFPGYVRHENKQCVEGNSYCGNCSKNEFWTTTGSPCQTECRTLGKKCTIVNIVAPRGCYCNSGYARDEHGVCIPIENCPGIKLFNFISQS